MVQATTLFHVSDIHFGIEDEDAHAWFAEAVRNERPDAVVLTGDITQRATHRQFETARKWLSLLDAPVVVEAGNHDMPYYNLWERFTRPQARVKSLIQSLGGRPDLPGVALVSFDTNVAAQTRWPWSDGVVKEEKLKAALERLEQLQDDPRPKLVTCHHPLLGPDDETKNPTIGGDAAFAALARAGADAVLSGHIHVPFNMVRSREDQTMRMIGAGTLSRRLRGAPPSYNVIRIEGRDNIAVEQCDFALGRG